MLDSGCGVMRGGKRTEIHEWREQNIKSGWKETNERVAETKPPPRGRCATVIGTNRRNMFGLFKKGFCSNDVAD